METILRILALLSVGLGMGLAIIAIWEIARKIFFPISKSGVDAIATVALLSALASRFVFKINGPIIYNIIIAIGAIIASVVFLKITK